MTKAPAGNPDLGRPAEGGGDRPLCPGNRNPTWMRRSLNCRVASRRPPTPQMQKPMKIQRAAVIPIAKSMWGGASAGRLPLSWAKKVKNGILMPEWESTPAEAKTRMSQM